MTTSVNQCCSYFIYWSVRHMLCDPSQIGNRLLCFSDSYPRDTSLIMGSSYFSHRSVWQALNYPSQVGQGLRWVILFTPINASIDKCSGHACRWYVGHSFDNLRIVGQFAV